MSTEKHLGVRALRWSAFRLAARAAHEAAFFSTLLACVLAAAAAAAAGEQARPAPARWVGTWASSAQLADAAQSAPAAGFPDTTVRQVVRVSIGGPRLRVRFSNAFGASPLTLLKAHVARAGGGAAIRPGSDRPLAFQGRASVTIPAGALVVSDPLDFELAPLSDLAITVYLRGSPKEITAHPGSRTTSYLQPGDAVSAAELAAPVRVDHWYFVNGVDVPAGDGTSAVAVLGDSITDGRGSTTNGNDRWTDHLARRLLQCANLGVWGQSREAAGSPQCGAPGFTPGAHSMSVLNQGIGGNRLLGDGLGQNALARLDRDVLAQPGVRHLIVLLGINDIGTRSATAEDLIAGYEQIIRRAHDHGIRVTGATLLPFEGYGPYFAAETEAHRQAVNAWIRTSGRFDGVIDFDAAVRDPAAPSRLLAAADGGDHLHPGPEGYRRMGEAVDLRLLFRH